MPEFLIGVCRKLLKFQPHHVKRKRGIKSFRKNVRSLRLIDSNSQAEETFPILFQQHGRG
jgi:hypothetical protein